MISIETNVTAVIRRLRQEGWVSEGGAKHDKFANPDRPGVKIMVPRHRTLTPGVARSIAKAAGWLGGEEGGDQRDDPVHRPD